MLILVALLAAVVIGWVLLGPLILPRAPAPSAAVLAGRWTRTPDAPLTTTLALSEDAYVLSGDLPHVGTGTAALEARVLVLSEDPACPDAVGRYEVRTEAIDRHGLLPQHTSEALTLVVIDDPCARGARASALTGDRWVLRASARPDAHGICDPPNEEAAITGHWPEPSGCA